MKKRFIVYAIMAVLIFTSASLDAFQEVLGNYQNLIMTIISLLGSVLIELGIVKHKESETKLSVINPLIEVKDAVNAKSNEAIGILRSLIQSATEPNKENLNRVNVLQLGIRDEVQKIETIRRVID